VDGKILFGISPQISQMSERIGFGCLRAWCKAGNKEFFIPVFFSAASAKSAGILCCTFATMIEKEIQKKENKATTFNLVLSPLRIVFMGTPEFAVASLDALVKAGYNIVGVVTAPDKPAGRGMQLQQSAVKKYAVEHHLNVLQPEKLKNPEFLDALKALKADLQIVVAFRMLPEVVWNMPPMGSVNLHGSLLPQYRGAAPINWAVINGEKETGVTTFKLKHEIDTGDILLQERFAIGENDTAGEVHDTMKEIGAAVLVKTVAGLAAGNLTETPQSQIGNLQSEIRHATKIFTDTCKIDFTKTVEEVHNLVRGLSPFPGAFTMLNGKTLKIYKSEKEIDKRSDGSKPSEAYLTDGKTFLKFACANGFIHVKELQLEGKKKMTVEDFLRGYRFTA
jgi:methionyl-tRNA formyltransferase